MNQYSTRTQNIDKWQNGFVIDFLKDFEDNILIYASYNLEIEEKKVGFPAFFLSLKNIYKIYMQFISNFAIICPNLNILNILYRGL